jgi:aminoglycoside phosphotransferase (APT) family kinase protein
VSAAGATEVVGLSPAAVEQWILSLGLGAQAPLRFARAGNGKSNLTYLVTDTAGAQWILRRPPVGPLLASAHDVAREHRILRALDPTEVPRPGVAGFTESNGSGRAPASYPPSIRLPSGSRRRCPSRTS